MDINIQWSVLSGQGWHTLPVSFTTAMAVATFMIFYSGAVVGNTYILNNYSTSGLSCGIYFAHSSYHSFSTTRTICIGY